MYDRNPSDPTNLYDPQHGVQWSVNVNDDDTRTMSAADVALAASRGELDPIDTFVWREGMGDWLPLGQCPELQDVIAQYAGGQYAGGHHGGGHAGPQGYGSSPSGAPGHAAQNYPEQNYPAQNHPAQGYGAAAAAPYGYEGGDDDDELGSTRVADVHAAGIGSMGSPGEEISRTMASPLESPYDAAEDVFAAARPAPASGPPSSAHFTGARNEESSLFSLDDLRREAASPSRNAPPGRAAPSPQNDDPFADLMSGAGGLAFEPPPLHAPAPPPPPKPAPMPVAAVAPSIAPMSAQAAAYPMAMAAPQKSKTGLIIGAAAGLLLLAGGAVAFMVGGSDETPQAKSEVAEDESKKDEAAPADPAEDETAAADADEETEEKDEEKDGEDEDGEDDDGEETAKKDDDDDAKKTTAVTSTKSDKTTEKKDDKVASTDKKKDDEKKKEDEKPVAKAEFNRDAARSALTAAAGAASGCKQKGGPTGRGQVTVTFAPSGRATQATVGPPFAGTAVGSCAAGAFKGASVPPFSGSSVTVSKSFFIK